MPDKKTTNAGKIVAITGPVVDVSFEGAALPDILNALEVENKFLKKKIVLEVSQLIGDNSVRAIAMDSTDGLVRGQEVIDTGGQITVPVGEEILGRMFNLLGEPIDELGDVEFKDRWQIHREAPPVTEQQTEIEILETGIKVID
ncbi:MAG: F0F1 ATP synthase subunit beta, partial [Mesotoga sp.]|nr:F0F1 ATP synthase subunit beta [Mesotoga sp.]